MRWWLLESYYDGSHRQLVDGLRERVVDESTLWTLPARKWKWRMRGASLEFARRAAQDPPAADALFATSMLDLAALRGLLTPELARIPAVLYFHENQLTYPVRHFDKRDHHFAWTHVQSALAADRVLWNSRWNRDGFLLALDRLAAKMPDHQPAWAVEEIARRSEVLPVPIDTETIEGDLRGVPARGGACHVVWNHRWEFDKGPDRLSRAMEGLLHSGLDFSVSIVGQTFRECPAEFEQLRLRLGTRLRTFGFVPDRADYHRLLASADVALSTARHEFQGLAVLEAAACGAVPLVPDALAYPEIWPQEWRYRDDDELVEALLARVREVERWRAVDPRKIAHTRSWVALEKPWRAVFAQEPARRILGDRR